MQYVPKRTEVCPCSARERERERVAKWEQWCADEATEEELDAADAELAKADRERYGEMGALLLKEILVKLVAYQKLQLGHAANQVVYSEYGAKLAEALGADAVRLLANLASRAGHHLNQHREGEA